MKKKTYNWEDIIGEPRGRKNDIATDRVPYWPYLGKGSHFGRRTEGFLSPVNMVCLIVSVVLLIVFVIIFLKIRAKL